jgi:hypothetical protein
LLRIRWSYLPHRRKALRFFFAPRERLVVPLTRRASHQEFLAAGDSVRSICPVFNVVLLGRGMAELAEGTDSLSF